MKDFNKIIQVFLVVIAILISALFISCDSYNKLKKENAYYKQLADSCFWHNYSIAADKVIDACLESDCDYIYDVIMETDIYCEYIDFYEIVHNSNISSPVKEE